MAKTAVIYWSGTGNTEAMANEICEGIKAGGTECDLFNVAEFTGSIDDYDKIALGCPAMGDEVLEECDFDPFYQGLNISGKRLHFSVHTAGETENGCVTGLKMQQPKVQDYMTKVL